MLISKRGFQAFAIFCVGAVFCTAAAVPERNVDPPTSYTVRFVVNYRWLNAQGKEQSNGDVGVTVGIDPDKALIEPWDALKTPSSSENHVWATSPARNDEWIISGICFGLHDKIKTLIIDNHPTSGMYDLFANLGRILYLPTNHPTYRGISSAARLYMGMESSSYLADEVTFRTTSQFVAGREVPATINAVTPEYYNVGLNEGGSFKKKFLALIQQENSGVSHC